MRPGFERPDARRHVLDSRWRVRAAGFAATAMLTACGAGATTAASSTSSVSSTPAASSADEATSTDNSVAVTSERSGTGASSPTSSSVTGTSASTNAATAATQLGAVGSLDTATVHEISFEFDQADFETAVNAYLADESKVWIEATVTIDGTAYPKAGIRLKGHSTMKGITTTTNPATVPWMVKLDKYTEQSADGMTDFIIRGNGLATALNEAVALELLGAAGLASQDAIGIAFSANGSDPVYRLAMENLDDTWMAEQLSASGALYKAKVGGDYTYRGADVSAYETAFEQDAGKKNADLTPVMEFLDFVNNSDEATFAADLDKHLDVDAFATYLAMETLLDNYDDVDGPGNNSFLYYDTEADRITVVPWDHNLAFGQRPTGVDGVQVGGGGARGGGARPAGGGGGPGRNANPLVNRFNSVPAFSALYNQKLAALRSSLFQSGTAADYLDQWKAIVASSGLVDEATISSDSQTITRKLNP